MATLNKIDQYNKGNMFPENYNETYIATQYICKDTLKIPNNIIDLLKNKIEEKNLYFGDDSVLQEIITGIIKGNIILQGPPGTGKTTLAKIICEVFNTSYTEITAISDWSTYDTIGGIQPVIDSNNNETFDGKNGLIVDAILKSCNTILENEKYSGNFTADWLIIDELNRCEIDKVFGELFTVFGNDDISQIKKINLPFYKNENKKEIYIPNKFRIIGTMNDVDKDFVFNISQGLSRRFSFISIYPPTEDHFIDEIKNAKIVASKKAIRKINNDSFILTDIINSSTFKNNENIIIDLLKRIRYKKDDSFLGLPLGTAQIIDLYESIFISIYVSDYKNSNSKEVMLKSIIDSQIANKIVPLLNGYDYTKLSDFINNFKSTSQFSFLIKTQVNLENLL